MKENKGKNNEMKQNKGKMIKLRRIREKDV